jgi:hypothetical protein
LILGRINDDSPQRDGNVSNEKLGIDVNRSCVMIGVEIAWKLIDSRGISLVEVTIQFELRFSLYFPDYFAYLTINFEKLEVFGSLFGF